jgi:RNA binding exosome subunit
MATKEELKELMKKWRELFSQHKSSKTIKVGNTIKWDGTTILFIIKGKQVAFVDMPEHMQLLHVHDVYDLMDQLLDFRSQEEESLLDSTDAVFNAIRKF